MEKIGFGKNTKRDPHINHDPPLAAGKRRALDGKITPVLAETLIAWREIKKAITSKNIHKY
jgi:hypothetical protein